MIILLYLSVIHLLEAWLEKVVIDLKNPYISDYALKNRQEHFRSAVLAAAWSFAAISALVHYEQAYWLIPAVVVNRRMFFDYPLIIFRDRPRRLYEGNDWWVKRFIWVFRERGRLKELFAETILTMISILFHLKYLSL